MTEQKEQERISTEELILAAAEQEFLTKGYAGARTTSIAKEAGVTHAMLHYYFRTKESLFERIIKEKIGVMSRSILAMLGDPALPIVERIRSGITAHFDFIAANPQLPLFLINEIISRPERYELLYNNLADGKITTVFAGLQRDIDEAVGRGEMLQVDARMLIISILSLNVFTFVAYPIIHPVMGELTADKDTFLAARRAENVEIIMRRITK